jgi:hypothetical protein
MTGAPDPSHSGNAPDGPVDAGIRTPTGAAAAAVWWRAPLAIAILVALGLFAHRRTPTYELLGFDTYLQINAGRITNLSDLRGTFTETLTDGRIAASFYRPLQNLSIALDYWIGRLNPRGYHVQSMIVYACCIALMYLTTRRLLGRGAWIGPLAATAFFSLHPVMLNVVPFPCRRSETLAIGFLLLSLLALSQRKPGVGFPALLAGLFVGLACGSKEVGALGVGLVFLHQWFYGQGAIVKKLHNAALATVPAFSFFGVYLINRTIVIGGLGGYSQQEEASYLKKMSQFFPSMAGDLLCPWSPIDLVSSQLTVWIVAAILGSLTILGLLSRLTGSGPTRFVGATALLGWAWMAPLVALIGLSQEYYPWYGVIALAGLALVCGAATEWCMLCWRGGGFRRLPAAAGFAGIAVVLVAALWTSPLWFEYNELAEASALHREELNELERRVDAAKLGDSLVVDLIPTYVRPPPTNRPALTNVSLLSFRSVMAWADLVHPETSIRVSMFFKAEEWRASNREILIKVRNVD